MTKTMRALVIDRTGDAGELHVAEVPRPTRVSDEVLVRVVTAAVNPIDVKTRGIDFLAAGNLKFLMGIPGIAFLYVRPELADTLRPTLTGWFGRVQPFRFDPKRLDWAPGARRFDTGTPPVLNAYIARAGMQA